MGESIAEMGEKTGNENTNDRKKLMYYNFLRCSRLTSATVLLVQEGNLTAAYALEKSLDDALLNGLYFGYVASDKEIEETIESALKGRCTGHSRMRQRAKMLDENF